MTYSDADPRFVYRFFADGGECLYVGCTTNFARRLADHLHRDWFPEVARIEVDRYPDYESGVRAESHLIRSLQPTHNRALTDHDTPRRVPCRKCHRSRHADCLGINSKGDRCPCKVCAQAKASA